MYIILMRHGEAEPETEDIANKNRSLTPKGMRQARKSARILSKFLKDNPIRIFTSPYQRTRQTAGILAEECFAEEIHADGYSEDAAECVQVVKRLLDIE